MKRNTIRKKIRQKINRSGNRECDVCKQSAILVEHHIEGQDIPFANKQSNLTSLCPNCHIKVHYGNIVIEGWAKTTIGNELLWHPKEQKSITGRDAKTYLINYKN